MCSHPADRRIADSLGIDPSPVFSDLPIPPGAVLDEELAARGITRQELAVRLELPLGFVDELVQGERAITGDIAVALSVAVDGIAADFWLGLESRYRKALAMSGARKSVSSPSDAAGAGGAVWYDDAALSPIG